MGFNCGIVGLPNVGKSTIFNALTAAGAASANYPFCTIDPNVGKVDVPDERIDKLIDVVGPQKVVRASMEFVDIAGLVKGASQGEGLGNQFLGHIRSTDAIAHVVRCFDSGDITHVDGSVDPVRDAETIQLELIYADMATVENAVNRYTKLQKTNQKHIAPTLEMLKSLQAHFENMLPARSFDHQQFVGDIAEVADAYRDLHLITAKKSIYVCNVDEDSVVDGNAYVDKIKAHAASENAQVVVLCGKIEEELSQLDADDKKEMIEGLGLKEPGLHHLIRAGYAALGLQNYFTAGVKEVRAWTIHTGDTAPMAAGKIHSDFERGFICAEVCTVDDFVAAGSRAKLKELGQLRMEGREYVVADGDVMEFRFNV